MKLKILKDFAGYKAGDTVENGHEWMIAKHLAEPLVETEITLSKSDFESLFEEELKPQKETNKGKIKPANKALKAPENK